MYNLLQETIRETVDLIVDLAEEAKYSEFLTRNGQPERILGRLLSDETTHLFFVETFVVSTENLCNYFL